MRVGLLQCSKAKASSFGPAYALYTGRLFRLGMAYCVANYDAWFILSARHGLVEPTRQIAPYEDTLVGASAARRREWAAAVWRQLADAKLLAHGLYFHAGHEYRDELIKLPGNWREPMAGIGTGFGLQLKWFRDRLPAASPKAGNISSASAIHPENNRPSKASAIPDGQNP